MHGVQFFLPRETDREKVTSLMIGKLSELPDSYIIDYKDIITSFPNLKELYVCTNCSIDYCGKGEIQDLWDNKLPKNPITLESEGIALHNAQDGFELAGAPKELSDVILLGWVWFAKKYFEILKEMHPVLNLGQVQLKFVGTPAGNPRHTFDCGCSSSFDGLGIFEHAASHECPIEQLRAMFGKGRSRLGSTLHPTSAP